MKKIVCLLLLFCLLLCGCGKQNPADSVSRTGTVPDVSEYEALLADSAWKTEGDVVWIFLDNELYEDYSLIYPYTIEGDQFVLDDIFYTFSALTGTRTRYPSESVSLPIFFSDENVMKIGDVEAYRDTSIDVSVLHDTTSSEATK